MIQVRSNFSSVLRRHFVFMFHCIAAGAASFLTPYAWHSSARKYQCLCQDDPSTSNQPAAGPVNDWFTKLKPPLPSAATSKRRTIDSHQSDNIVQLTLASYIFHCTSLSPTNFYRTCTFFRLRTRLTNHVILRQHHVEDQKRLRGCRQCLRS